MITTLSFITIALATYYLYIDTRIAAIFFIVSYSLDCSDGMFARKYDMCSQFGKVYDYFKDWIMLTIFYISFLKIYTSYYNISFVITCLVSLAIAYLYITWYNINEAINHYKKHNNTDYYSHAKRQAKKSLLNIIYLGTLRLFYNLAKPYIKNPDKMKSNAKILRIFGSGNLTVLLFIILIIFVIA
ncbi:MAG: CDP-alcohol phosphatidyltransferase family protein [archaeon]